MVNVTNRPKRLLSTDIEFLWLELGQALIRLSLTPEQIAQENALLAAAADDLMMGPAANAYSDLMASRYVVGATKILMKRFDEMRKAKKLFKEKGWEVKLTFPGQISNEFIRNLKPGLRDRLLADDDFKANGPNWGAEELVNWINNLYENRTPVRKPQARIGRPRKS